ncbi:unnamed protein product [Linum trigynum]|uniref:Uncharacterized protein n=1 Tax=Linum trigynum TaxID=586398 RepID=A0AAV2F6H3_9ROSI
MTVSRGKMGIRMAFLILSILLCSSLIRASEKHACPPGGNPDEECKANENGLVDLDDDFDDTYKIVNKMVVQPPSFRAPDTDALMGDGGSDTDVRIEGH